MITKDLSTLETWDFKSLVKPVCNGLYSLVACLSKSLSEIKLQELFKYNWLDQSSLEDHLEKSGEFLKLEIVIF